MANIIGYVIGALFVCLLLSPIPIGLWQAYSLIELLRNSTSENATIIGCVQRKAKSGGQVKRSWVPQALTENKLKVVGSFGWKKKRWCERGIGDSVSVLVHTGDEEKSKINTFFQLWFFPLLIWSVVIALGSAAIKKWT